MCFQINTYDKLAVLGQDRLILINIKSILISFFPVIHIYVSAALCSCSMEHTSFSVKLGAGNDPFSLLG